MKVLTNSIYSLVFVGEFHNDIINVKQFNPKSQMHHSLFNKYIYISRVPFYQVSKLTPFYSIINVHNPLPNEEVWLKGIG